jgi:hypothetical protein
MRRTAVVGQRSNKQARGAHERTSFKAKKKPAGLVDRAGLLVVLAADIYWLLKPQGLIAPARGTARRLR